MYSVSLPSSSNEKKEWKRQNSFVFRFIPSVSTLFCFCLLIPLKNGWYKRKIMLNFSIYFQREFLFYAIIWKRQTETFITKTRRKVLKVAINWAKVEKNERIKEGKKDWMNEWKNDWMNERMVEWMKEWMNEWL